MPPALVIAIETLELSPLFSTKVPPARTGLAVTPMLLKPTAVPAVMFETLVPPEDEPEPPELHTLQIVMSKFQMPDVGVVCVNAKV